VQIPHFGHIREIKLESQVFGNNILRSSKIVHRKIIDIVRQRYGKPITRKSFISISQSGTQSVLLGGIFRFVPYSRGKMIYPIVTSYVPNKIDLPNVLHIVFIVGIEYGSIIIQ